MFAKMKSKLKLPEVKAVLYILGGILSVFVFLFTLVNFTDFTIISVIVGFISFLFYKLWEVIVQEIKKNERRKANKR